MRWFDSTRGHSSSLIAPQQLPRAGAVLSIDASRPAPRSDRVLAGRLWLAARDGEAGAAAGAGACLRLGRESRLGLPAGGEAEADRPLRARPRRPEGDDAVPPPAVARASRARGRRGDLPRLRDLPGAAAGGQAHRAGRRECAATRGDGRPGGRDRLLARRTARGRLRERLFSHRVSCRAGSSASSPPG